ncbi:MAG TPA: gliding motility-associated C-terminal domain-containing protein [bacterium]
MFTLYLCSIFTLTDSALVITEVMSNVKGSESTCGKRNEFVEVYNQSSDTIDLAAYKIFDFDNKSIGPDAIPDELFSWDDSTILVKYPKVRIRSTLLYPLSYALILDRDYSGTDTSGGNVQPYDLPDSVLIITTDDHSICDGLTTTDPLLIYTSDAVACTTTFGTPLDDTDGFPYDPGDGISWERIDLAKPDSSSNWYPCIDAAGCTPGRANSTVTACDLALDEACIFIAPATIKSGEDAMIEVVVINNGLHATNDYTLIVYDDINRDSTKQSNEIVANLPGEPAGAFDSVSVFCTYERPVQGEHLLGFELEAVGDTKCENNLVFKTMIVVGDVGELAVTPAVFTPNNDGINDRAQIDYRLPEPYGDLTVTIFDSRGKRVCDLCRKAVASTTRGTLYWNGGGMPTGMYVVYLEYVCHNKINRAKTTTVLAR